MRHEGRQHSNETNSETLGLLTVDEVCARLRIARSTWEKWRARRICPRVIRLPNGSTRVRESDLEVWVRSFEEDQ